MPPITLVIASLRHNGPTSELSAIPAATIQPVTEDRAKLVISGTPSSDTVCSRASVAQHLGIERRRGALGDRLLRIWRAREIDAVAVEDRDGPVFARALPVDDALKNLDRRGEGNIVEHLAFAKHWHLDR